MPLVLQRRGEILEAAHPWSAALIDDRVAWIGDPVGAAWRSAAKPFQLWCSLEALGDPALSEREIAVGASSHTAEPEHVALVRGLLARFGLDESALRCAPHSPIYAPAAHAILRAGGGFTDIHNNCSGKHTFMRAASAARGWPADYRDPTHPLQRRIRQQIVGWCEGEPDHGVDGCGVPTFGLPIDGFARAWRALALAMADHPAGRLGAIGWAMSRHPRLTSGSERLDLAVASAVTEPMVGKIGAQGLFCMAFPQRGLGVAVKTHTGDEPALAVAVAEVLDRLGAWERPADWPWSTVLNVAGRPIGDRVAG